MGSAPSRQPQTDLSSFTVNTCANLRDAAAVVSKERGVKAFGSILEAKLTAIYESFEEFESRLSDEELGAQELMILDHLERLCQWPEPFTSPSESQSSRVSEFSPTWYPRLNCLTSQNHSAQTAIKTVAKNPTAKKFRENLFKSLQPFTDLGPVSKGPDLSELKKANDAKQDPHDKQVFVRSLYKAVCEHCLCKCSRDWTYTTSNLQLNWPCEEVKAEDEQLDGPASFGLLFLDHHRFEPLSSSQRWQDTEISVHRSSKTRFDGNTIEYQEKDQYFSGPLNSCNSHQDYAFCELIKNGIGGPRAQLKLVVSDNGLKHVSTLQSRFLNNLPSIPLSSLITSRCLDGKMKVLLSYLLARSVWQFYGSDWMKDEWTKETVHFMFSHDPRFSEVIFINEPFLQTRIGPVALDKPPAEQRKTTGKFMIHFYPKILALGIMLLEIEIGRTIEEFKDSCEDDLNADYTAVSKIVCDEKLWPENPFTAIREAIDICVKPDTEKLGINEKEMRHHLYEWVVDPLQKLFQAAWRTNPDTDKVHLATGKLKTGAKSWHWPLSHSTSSMSSPEKANDRSHQSCQESIPRSTTTTDHSLSSSVTVSAPRYTLTGSGGMSSKIWFQEMDKLNGLLRIRDKDRDTDAKPVKIAILDTGISPDYSRSVKDSIKGYINFVNRSHTEPEDRTQHGTNSVRLVQKIYRSAEIYVGRVFDTNEANDLTPRLMAEAIRHSVNEWQVDIIALPSGFEEENADILSAIERANNTRTLVFAAASNYGNCRPIAFPGRLYVANKVLCMFSTTAEVKAASLGFNPQASTRAQFNFAILGSQVQLTPNEAPLSGTSVSTVIGAALACRVLDFSRHPDIRSHKNAASFGYLKQVEGMTAVFALMVNYPDNGYHCIAPWKLLPFARPETPKSEIRMDICSKILEALKHRY